MFYRITDEKIYDYADYKYAEDCFESNITTKKELDENKDKFGIQNGILTDISSTDEYKMLQTEKENAAKKAKIQAQIDELDKKRIRALAEGGNYSDSQTYLEYYTAQIQTLRAEMQ